MTTSETLFEEYCKRGGIALTRLKPDGAKTPDFEVTLGGIHVIVEVKEFTATEDDEQAVRDFEQKGWAVWGSGKPGSRVRHKIEAGKRQLERLAVGQCPAMLLLYDARPIVVSGIAPYEVLVAMYGLESIDLDVPAVMAEPVRLRTRRFGRGRKVGPDCHTYISAVGVLHDKGAQAGLHVDVYDNVFATTPLPLDHIVTRDDMTAFSIPRGVGNEFRQWARVVGDDE